MKNYERVVWVGAVVLALFAGFWIRLAPEKTGPDAPASSSVTSIEARCGVAAGGALSSRELAITCGLDDAGIEAVIADAIGELDLAGLVKQIQQGAADLPTAVDQMAMRLGITREAVVELLGKLGSNNTGEGISAAALARTITRGKPLLVVNVTSTVSRTPSGDAQTEIPAVGDPSLEDETATRRSGKESEDARIQDVSKAVIEESKKLQVECGVVAGSDAELGIAQITCGPDKEDIDVIIKRLVEQSQIDQVIHDLRQGTLTHTELLDTFQTELNLSRTTALALLKQVADAGPASGQAASELSTLTKKHLELTYRLGLLPVDNPSARKLRDLAAAAVSAGDFTTAETLLQQWSELQKTGDELSAAQREVVALRGKLDALTQAQQADATEQIVKADGGDQQGTLRQDSAGAEEPSAEDAPTLIIRQDRVVLKVPGEVDAGAMIKVEWRGPAAPGDLIFVAPIDQAENTYPGSDRNRHDASEGSPAMLTAPADPGKYEVRYLSYANAKPLKREPLEVIAPQVKFHAPKTIPAGSVMEFDWTGPDSPGDLLFIAEPAVEKDRYFSSDRQRHATSAGSPAILVAPAREGNYEIRYYSYNNGSPLLSRSLVVKPPEVRLAAPDTVNPGAHLRLSWDGPNAPGDMIFIARRDLEKDKYVLTGRHRHLTSDGPVAELVAPADPGDYEIRYFSYANGAALSTVPLTVE